MGFKFRKSIKIAPGVKLNINKKSIGISAGTRGARVSVNSKGKATTTVGIPGSGLSYSKTTNIGGEKNSRGNNNFESFSAQNQKNKKNGKKILLIILGLMFWPVLFVAGIIPSVLYFPFLRKKVDPNKKKLYDIVAGIILAITTVIVVNEILNPVYPAENIEISVQNVEMNVNSSQNIDIKVTPDNANTEIEYITEDSDILTFEDVDNIPVLKSASKEGKTIIYAKSGDVESNKIELNVIDEERIAKEKAEAERLAKEEAERKAEQERIAQEEAQRKAEQERIAQEEAQKEYTTMVWIPSSGSGKYHKKSTCSKMKNAVQISLEDAQNRGIQPCKICY